MKIRYPEYYRDFKCAAAKCSDSCCIAWDVAVDRESAAKYSDINGGFGEKLRDNMSFDGEDFVFVQKKGRCPFLDRENLCEIYKNLGEESLCYTCRRYPRFIDEFGALREEGLSLSCIEAAKIILSRRETRFITEETDEPITQYNTIDADLYISVMAIREKLIKILQDKTISIHRRIIAALDFCAAADKRIRRGKCGDVNSVILSYSGEYIKERVLSLDRSNPKRRPKELLKLLDTVCETQKLTMDWAQTIYRMRASAENGISFFAVFDDKEAEQLMVYFIYRYFLKSVDDKKPLLRLKFAAVSVIIIYTLIAFAGYEGKDTDTVIWAHRYSKEIEHCGENMQKLMDFSDKIMLKTLINLLKV